MTIEQVPGKDCGNVFLYTLSTCGWCKKTKELLHELGVQYRYVDVNLLGMDEQEEALEALKKLNPEGSFPTIIVNDSEVICGYNPDQLRAALKG